MKRQSSGVQVMVPPRPITDHDTGVPGDSGWSAIETTAPYYAEEIDAPAPNNTSTPQGRFHPVPTRDVFLPNPQESVPGASRQPIYLAPPSVPQVVPLNEGE